MPSNHRKGYYRDSRIMLAIEQYRVLDTEQLTLMFFNDLKQGPPIARRRLLKLIKQRRIKRVREAHDMPYCYYHDKHRQPVHATGVNWVRLWLERTLHSWEVIHSFHYEQDYGILRADGFAAIKNKVTGKHKFYFIEFDNALSGNAFDKVAKYNALFSKPITAWWTELTIRFPAIVIVTTGSTQMINRKIKDENENNLEFIVHALEHIKEVCHANQDA